MALGVGWNLDLDLERLALLLGSVGLGETTAELSRRLGFHNTMIGSLRSWSRALGLLLDAETRSPLGQALMRLDPTLRHPATQLVLFRQLGRNPNAEAWFFLINTFFHDVAIRRTMFSAAEARAAAARAGVGSSSRGIAQRDRDVMLAIRTLRRPQAFGSLCLLHQVGSGTDSRFQVIPGDASTTFIAYALADEWPAGSLYVSFGELEQPTRLGRLLWRSRPEFVGLLRRAEADGYIQVHEEAGFDRVARTRDYSTMELLEALYA